MNNEYTQAKQGKQKILFIGDLRSANNFGAIATTETLIGFLKNHSQWSEIKYIDYKSLYYSTPINGWGDHRFEDKFKTIAKKILPITIIKIIALLKSKIAFSQRVEFIPCKYSLYEKFYNKMLNGEILQYEKQMLQWADLVLINGEGNIVNGTDKYGKYRQGGLYILFITWLSKVKYNKKTLVVNHTVDPANNDALEIIKNLYPLLDLVYVRETLSIKKLQEIGVNNALFVPDALFGYIPKLNWSPSKELMDHIDFSKPYWDRSMNSFLTINNHRPMAIGSFNIATYDLSFALLFNKKLIENLGMPVPYDLVRTGVWTMDSMNDMMRSFTLDVNGNGIMDDADNYGYVAHPKMVLPNFTVAAGAFMIKKDSQDLPYLGMTDERFLNVLDKVLGMMWDGGNWWNNTNLDADIPSAGINKFQEGGALFMDTSLFEIEKLRGMETDFGILPYPKLDETQDRYYGRVSYYVPTLVPVSNNELEMTGALFEALNAESYRTVLPTYLDTILMVRNTRDNESAEMLSLMFDSFVVDMGDSTMCSTIRDGMLWGFFINNNRQFVSAIEKQERQINRQLEKMVEAAQ